MHVYEEELNRSTRWALQEAGLHFEQKSAVHQTLRRIAQWLDELSIRHAIAGSMALFFHGYRKFTEAVDLLVTSEGLKTIHQNLEGLGYRPLYAGSRHLRDTDSGVRVEFLVTGEFPGDGKPKPVAFPDPIQSMELIDGVPVLNLPSIFNLKLASGMTNPGRLKDLADAQELIRILRLPADFADQLNPFVRDKFTELHRALADNPPTD